MAKLSTEEIAALVDRGLILAASLKTIKKELEEIDEKLKTAGLENKHTELKDADREGRRWEASGSRCKVPVVFTADALIKSFAKDSDTHTRVLTAIGDASKLELFFKFKPSFENTEKDGKDFREKADRELGVLAPSFITACLQRGRGGIPKSSVKVEWDEALASLGTAMATLPTQTTFEAKEAA